MKFAFGSLLVPALYVWATLAAAESSVLVNQEPSIAGSPMASRKANQLYFFVPTAHDPDGDPLVFQIRNRPSWANFDPATGRLFGMPAPADMGTWTDIVISASDGAAVAALPAFSITVTAPNRPPVISYSASGTPVSDVRANRLYFFTPAAHDPDGDPLVFRVRNRPSWANFDPATGRLFGMPAPADMGTWTDIVISASDGAAVAALPAFSITVAAPNRPPMFSSHSASDPQVQHALAERPYAFRPLVHDPDGDPMTFRVRNQPSWASFDPATGRLSGTPALADVGTWTNIVISASDGAANAESPPFAIAVEPPGSGTATLTWTPPTQNTDGSPLSDLAGFVVFLGRAPGDFRYALRLPDPGLTSVVIEDLPPATWYFAVKASTASGLESDYSNVVSKTIS